MKPLSYPIDQHQQDARFKLGEANAPTPTLTSKMGMGGNNTPMILQRIDGGGANEVMSAAGFLHHQGNEHIGYQEEVAPTIVAYTNSAAVVYTRQKKNKSDR